MINDGTLAESNAQCQSQSTALTALTVAAVAGVVPNQAVMGDGSVTDGTLAESEAQSGGIWRIREGITESLVRRGGPGAFNMYAAIFDHTINSYQVVLQGSSSGSS